MLRINPTKSSASVCRYESGFLNDVQLKTSSIDDGTGINIFPKSLILLPLLDEISRHKSDDSRRKFWRRLKLFIDDDWAVLSSSHLLDGEKQNNYSRNPLNGVKFGDKFVQHLTFSTLHLFFKQAEANDFIYQ